MKVLVTGGAGFIGSHVVEAFLAAGHEVVALDIAADQKAENVNPQARAVQMDVTSYQLDEFLAAERFDLVSHHAAEVSVSKSVADPIADAHTNILGILNLLQGCVKHKVRKVLFASSGGTVYGPTTNLPAVETLPFDAGSPYGVAKVASELYLKVFAAEHGLRYTALRYSNVYGPRQDPHGEAGVVAIFTRKMLAGESPVIHGDGAYVRDYVYVEDVARASVLAMDQGDGQGINIGTGRQVTTNELFRTLKGLTGYAGEERHGPARAGDLRANYLANAKAKAVLGWTPAVTLEDGLKRTVEWFKRRASRA